MGLKNLCSMMFGVKELFGYLHMSLSKPAEANVSPEG